MKYLMFLLLFIAVNTINAQRSHCASGGFIKTIAIDDVIRQHKAKKAKKARDVARLAKKNAKIVATKQQVISL
jgi:hypothetical protein